MQPVKLMILPVLGLIENISDDSSSLLPQGSVQDPSTGSLMQCGHDWVM